MQSATLGPVGTVSRLTLGGGGIGQIWGETSTADGIATLHHAIDAGITLIDTAPMYGSCEAVMLQAFGGKIPAGVRITTKCQLGTPPAGEAARRLTQGESHRLPFATDAFDAVISTYALEHFVFPRESLEEMWRVCRPGGRVAPGPAGMGEPGAGRQGSAVGVGLPPPGGRAAARESERDLQARAEYVVAASTYRHLRSRIKLYRREQMPLVPAAPKKPVLRKHTGNNDFRPEGMP